MHHAEKLHNRVLADLRVLLDDDERLAAAIIVPEAAPPPDLAPERQRLEKRLANAKMLALDGVLSPSEYATTRAELQAQLSALDALPAPVIAPTLDLAGARATIRAVLDGAPLSAIADALALEVAVGPNDWPRGVAYRGPDLQAVLSYRLRI